jgi:hypothetical protein
MPWVIPSTSAIILRDLECTVVAGAVANGARAPETKAIELEVCSTTLKSTILSAASRQLHHGYETSMSDEHCRACFVSASHLIFCLRTTSTFFCVGKHVFSLPS